MLNTSVTTNFAPIESSFEGNNHPWLEGLTMLVDGGSDCGSSSKMGTPFPAASLQLHGKQSKKNKKKEPSDCILIILLQTGG